MRRIRVLIVDDAVVVRRLVADVLSADPEIELAGTAASGSIALAKIPQVNPDVITLDVEMPGMSGLETLAEIRRQYPSIRVIMFSTLTERGAATTLDALSLGASDYVAKPSNTGSIDAAIERVRADLVPKVKAFCARVAGLASPSARPAMPPLRPAQPRARSPVDVVAIGVSTGGPNALATLLPLLPADLPVPVLIVQHMPPVFTRLLAERLATRAPFPVAEGRQGAVLQPGTAWIAPGDHHMEVRREGTAVVLTLHQGAPENSCRPAVDPLFRSVARVYGATVLAAVLTGMGHDGLRGAQAIREAGGRVLAQDEASSVVWGMPGAVTNAGLADRVLPLEQIASEIAWRVRGRRSAPDLTALEAGSA